MKITNWFDQRFEVNGEKKRHQSARETNRRIRQVMKGELQMEGVHETRQQWEDRFRSQEAAS